MLVAADLLELFRTQLQLCRLEAGEKVVVLSEPRSPQSYVAAAFAAAQNLGGLPMVVTLPGDSPTGTPMVRTGSGFGIKALDDNPMALTTLRQADLVIDVTLEGFIHSPFLGKILGGDTFVDPGADRPPGPRVLYVCEPPEVLARNMPHPDDKKRAQEATAKMSAAKEMRVTSSAGTDLVINLVDAVVGYQCGFADEPGRWDHWPSNMVLCFPQLDGVNGVIVMEPGDLLFPFKEFIQESTRFTLQGGNVAQVEGGVSAAMLNRYFEDTNDPEARLTSHFGWGLSRTAEWTTVGMYNKENVMGMEARAFKGGFMWSTGPNSFVERYCPYHLDLVVRDCTITLDGVTVVDEGILVE